MLQPNLGRPAYATSVLLYNRIYCSCGFNTVKERTGVGSFVWTEGDTCI